ncbi:MAG: thioredoxin family protein [Phycisphaeraceae bacterium]|nr:thioredoxin family protein [Phycisphaerae bacterium]MBX3391257.1 thioredoxin family protein [Phycisphaeraceae bacterium]HRJ50294.1 thioredoxin family protein [Phycisphaerales bacterium]
MVSPDDLRRAFQAGHEFEAYLNTATPSQRENWTRFIERVPPLTPSQVGLIQGFTREMPVLVISGTWCGDCVQQCPLIDAIARAGPSVLRVRYVDRDRHADLSDQVMICGGRRVPTVIFMNEDHEFVSILGDRTLMRYRSIAARSLGVSCPLPGAAVPTDEITSTMQDWINEFERVALLLRLSPKLRERYGD